MAAHLVEPTGVPLASCPAPKLRRLVGSHGVRLVVKALLAHEPGVLDFGPRQAAALWVALRRRAP